MSKGYTMRRDDLATVVEVQALVDENPPMYIVGTIIVAADGGSYLVSANDGTTVTLTEVSEPTPPFEVASADRSSGTTTGMNVNTSFPIGASPSIQGWTVTADAAGRTISQITSADTTRYRLVITASVTVGQTVLVSYDGTGDAVDVLGRPLTPFVDEVVVPI